MVLSSLAALPKGWIVLRCICGTHKVCGQMPNDGKQSVLFVRTRRLRRSHGLCASGGWNTFFLQTTTDGRQREEGASLRSGREGAGVIRYAVLC